MSFHNEITEEGDLFNAIDRFEPFFKIVDHSVN
jgi:hypothetical protein